MNKKLLLICCLSMGLLACGGSSDSITREEALELNESPNSVGTVLPISEDIYIELYGDELVNIGEAVGFVVLPKANQSIESINWRQISGPQLNILAANSQSIGFDVLEAGSYSLQAEVILDGNNTLRTYDVNFSTTSAQQDTNVRLDHSVSELDGVSLHVGTANDKSVLRVDWTQVAGPQVDILDTEDEEYLFFNAPSVTEDSLIKFQAEVSYSDGTSALDEVFVAVKDVEYDTDGLFYGNDFYISEDMHAYIATSPYKDALEECVYSNQIPNPPSCTFEDLPLLGMVTNSPSLEDVLNRTLVSHQWMGDRFKEFLENSAAGPDMLMLLRGTNAVVISYEVRPSFYWAATGAIYLDANNFWLTPAERDTLNDQPDYRSDFGSDLQFSMFWRYTKDNDYYPSNFIAKNNRIERSFDDLEATISWLMYHELAHANDFFPADAWTNISSNTSPLNYVFNNGTNSDTLEQNFPLRSDEMHSLAQVRFSNTTPTSAEINYRGTDIEGFFVPDVAGTFYSYLTTREDFAILFERYMMLYRLGSEADVAIIDGRTQSNEPLVVWGQRNRITESSLEDRTVFTVESVYPELSNVRDTLRSLNTSILMTPNLGWFENISISPEASLRSQSTRETLKAPYSLEYMQTRERLDKRSQHEQKPAFLQ